MVRSRAWKISPTRGHANCTIEQTYKNTLLLLSSSLPAVEPQVCIPDLEAVPCERFENVEGLGSTLGRDLQLKLTIDVVWEVETHACEWGLLLWLGQLGGSAP